jgi:NAD(P)-dependent dehydrogenase (short-subunit alcohol dehydrogenase family)
MSKRFEGKTCIVTGSGSGIGREITRGILAEGGTVIANDLREEGLEEYADNPNAHGVVGDTSAPQTGGLLVEAALAATGQLDVLVNCAGVSLAGPAEDLSDEHWRRSMDINLSGYFYLAKAAGKAMIPRRSGVILNVSSMAGLVGVPENVAYVASKHGVIGLTRGLCIDWARYGIRVNALCPGLTETELIAQRTREAPEKFAARRARILNGRPAQPIEQARVALFLISDDSDYVSGLMANVDAGGHALYSGFAAPALPVE